MKVNVALLLLTAASMNLCYAQQTYYDVTVGNGNGVRFWSQDAYKIHMGTGEEYQFGPVSDYSIKMNMNNDSGRGWTWGVYGQTPVAAINTLGQMQIAGSFNASSIAVGGTGVITSGGSDVYANIRVIRNTSPSLTDGMYIGYAGSGGPLRFFSNSGTTEFMSLVTDGNLGLGTTTPSSWFAGRVLEMADVRPILKLASTNPAGISTLLFTNSSVNSSTHTGEFHVNYQFDQTNNDKSLIRFGAYPASDILTLRADGNVGIGTTTSNAPLQFANTSVSRKIVLFEAVNNDHHFIGFGVNASALRYQVYDPAIDHVFYAAASSSTSNELMRIKGNGNVGIGTANPDAKLAVKGQIHAQEVKVDLNGAVAPDYVFEKNYKLPSLESIQSYIDQHKHLPEVPSAKEMAANGVNLGEMNMLLLKKVEELTLYVLQQQRELGDYKAEMLNLKAELNKDKK